MIAESLNRKFRDFHQRGVIDAASPVIECSAVPSLRDIALLKCYRDILSGKCSLQDDPELETRFYEILPTDLLLSEVCNVKNENYWLRRLHQEMSCALMRADYADEANNLRQRKHEAARRFHLEDILRQHSTSRNKRIKRDRKNSFERQTGAKEEYSESNVTELISFRSLYLNIYMSAFFSSTSDISTGSTIDKSGITTRPNTGYVSANSLNYSYLPTEQTNPLYRSCGYMPPHSVSRDSLLSCVTKLLGECTRLNLVLQPNSSDSNLQFIGSLQYLETLEVTFINLNIVSPLFVDAKELDATAELFSCLADPEVEKRSSDTLRGFTFLERYGSEAGFITSAQAEELYNPLVNIQQNSINAIAPGFSVPGATACASTQRQMLRVLAVNSGTTPKGAKDLVVTENDAKKTFVHVPNAYETRLVHSSNTEIDGVKLPDVKDALCSEVAGGASAILADIVELCSILDTVNVGTVAVVNSGLSATHARCIAAAMLNNLRKSNKWDSKKPICEKLSLPFNKIDDSACRDIAKLFAGASANKNAQGIRGLRELSLENNLISFVGVKSIVKGIACPQSSLVTLILDGNDIGDAGLEIIVDALSKAKTKYAHENPMEQISLRRCGITWHAIEVLIRLLKLSAVKVLDLSGNINMIYAFKDLVRIMGLGEGDFLNQKRSQVEEKNSDGLLAINDYTTKETRQALKALASAISVSDTKIVGLEFLYVLQ